VVPIENTPDQHGADDGDGGRTNALLLEVLAGPDGSIRPPVNLKNGRRTRTPKPGDARGAWKIAIVKEGFGPRTRERRRRRLVRRAPAGGVPPSSAPRSTRFDPAAATGRPRHLDTIAVEGRPWELM